MVQLSVVQSDRDADDSDAAEAALLRCIAAGDRAALGILYRRYHRRLARFLSQLTRRADVVEEAINDAFFVVWQRADRYRGDARVSTWILGIAWRCAHKALRVHRDAADGVDAEASLPADDPFALHEVNDWVMQALRRLTAEQRVTLELAYGGGHSLEEIAVILDCPVSTVKARMFHARARMRDLLPLLAGARAKPSA